MSIIQRIGYLTASESDFVEGSFRGVNVYRKDLDINVYELHSYNVLIAFKVDTGSEVVWFLNTEKYSTTTSKHRNAMAQKRFDHTFNNEEDTRGALINPLRYLLSKQLPTNEDTKKAVKI